MITFEILFWLSLAALFYVNLGYLLILILISLFCNRPKANFQNPYEPSVTLLITAYNEQDVIREKLNNVLETDYPKNKLQVIVGSDDSTDSTNKIVGDFLTEGFELYVVKPRLGKTNVLNKIIGHARGEILVFTDANVFFERCAIRSLVRYFVEGSVGCVSGSILPLAAFESPTGYGGGLYWRLEEKIKQKESMIGSCMGATGAIFALRKELYKGYPNGIIPDLVPSLQVLTEGRSIRHCPDAIAYERMTTSAREEFVRKRRIVGRSLRGLIYLKTLLNPFKYPLVSFQLVSHKVLRWLGFLFLITVFQANLMLALKSDGLWFYLLAFQITFYSLAGAGFALDLFKIKSRLFAIPHYFLLANFAAFLGIIDFLTGNVSAIWEQAKTSRKKQ